MWRATWGARYRPGTGERMSARGRASLTTRRQYVTVTAHMGTRPSRESDQLDAVFFALASEPRRRILDALEEGGGGG